MSLNYEGVKLLEDGSEIGWDSAAHDVILILNGQPIGGPLGSGTTGTVATPQTASVASLATYTPTSAGTYKISGVITNTSGTNTGTTILEVTYTDIFGTVHTGDIIPLAAAAGTYTITGATGASTEWKGFTVEITSGASAITVKTVVSGSVNYIASASIT